MNQVLARLYIGDGADGRDADALRSAGITAVMNATPETDSLTGQGFAYLRLNQPDATEIPGYVLDSFLAWMRREMFGHKSKILIHCGAGVSRAATFTIVWLMCAGFEWDEAEALVRSKRPQIAPHPLLKESVLRYFGAL